MNGRFIHPKSVIADNSEKKTACESWRSELISAEWQLRYWAHGPRFFKGGKVVTHKQVTIIITKK